ncbi:acetolactate synthase small subunit, partial [Escherichia coli]
MRRILSVLLENESGALSRVIGLFSQRGYNIESLTVAPTDDPTLSRMTIQTVGDEKVLEQIEKQLHKLVDVLRVSELGQGAHVEPRWEKRPITRDNAPDSFSSKTDN